MLKHIIAAAALASLASASFAAEQTTVQYKPTGAAAPAATGFYVGADLGATEMSYSDKTKLSYGLLAGYKFNQHFAVEAGVRKLAHDSDNYYDSNAKQYSVSALGILPLQNGFSVFGRLGLNRVSEDLGYNHEYRHRDTKILYGMGVGYDLAKNITTRLEVQKPASNITNVSASLLYSF